MNQVLLFNKIPIEYLFIAIKILIVVLIFIAILTTINYLMNGKIIVKFARNSVKKMEIDQIQRSKKYVEDVYNYKQPKKTFLYMIDKRFEYSGLQKKLPFLSSGLYFAISIISASIISMSCLVITKNLIWSIALACLIFAIAYMIEGIMSYMNYLAVEKDLSEFLSELKAFSASSDDILTCIRAISENMHEPLRSVLYEFYVQAQSTGEKSKAFYDLMNKIEHPMFKQITRNIEFCTRHSADYGIIVDNCRKTLRNYLKSRKDIDTQNKSEFMIMLILLVAGIGSISIMKLFTGTNVWDELLHTPLGNIFLIVQSGIFLLFTWNSLFSSKN